ncbi:hypothetical protein [Roseateles sp. PN1]|uniref:hypothetical protein n=1 Tax=Roseateles sp. PN1 TaxID=3137372 RepID=UPI003138F0FA
MKATIIYKIISSTSNILAFIGPKVMGAPKQWGLDCSSREFYCMPIDRVAANPLLKTQAIQWSQQTRNMRVNFHRRKAFAAACIAATVFASGAYVAGTGLLFTVNKTKQAIGTVQTKFAASSNDKEAKEQRVAQLRQEAQELQRKANSGEVTKEDYLKRVGEIDKEFQELTK